MVDEHIGMYPPKVKSAQANSSALDTIGTWTGIVRILADTNMNSVSLLCLLALISVCTADVVLTTTYGGYGCVSTPVSQMQAEVMLCYPSVNSLGAATSYRYYCQVNNASLLHYNTPDCSGAVNSTTVCAECTCFPFLGTSLTLHSVYPQHARPLLVDPSSTRAQRVFPLSQAGPTFGLFRP
jgi:hypothetical protein